MSKFKKGESGNPTGRPVGLPASTKIRSDIEKALPDILKTVIQQAKDGDIQAAKILLDKICPNLRPVALPLNLPLPVNGGLVEQGDEVIKATLSGQIPPDIGSQLITALSNQGKLIDLQEMSDRLKRIEKQLEART